jgi:hypothetical protein
LATGAGCTAKELKGRRIAAGGGFCIKQELFNFYKGVSEWTEAKIASHCISTNPKASATRAISATTSQHTDKTPRSVQAATAQQAPPPMEESANAASWSGAGLSVVEGCATSPFVGLGAAAWAQQVPGRSARLPVVLGYLGCAPATTKRLREEEYDTRSIFLSCHVDFL